MEQHDLVYSDWTSCENSDGCYEHFAELEIPQVALLETNPYLLALTIIISIVHSVFEFLAFKKGFITMTPQLFINYKLRSVAHLPWRMLTHKALNTFTEDLFAFIIKMPARHVLDRLPEGRPGLLHLPLPAVDLARRSHQGEGAGHKRAG
ncbi:CLPTM1-like membrane protein cnrB [Oryctolagus cuniculus]|uniref:CLPTM1-like membrane protein cnrB n=1 Tax=Oryctolagus cuniculus TaxID=9986 RepID=UPI003879384C